MLILAIETSCDETSLCFMRSVDITNNSDISSGLYSYLNSFKILSSVISSQIEIHAEYGGVVPEIGARNHADQIHFLFEQIIRESGFKLDELVLELKYIFVTTTPGLPSALRVGVEFAKSLKHFIKTKYHKEVILKNINHLKGHVASSFYELDQSLIIS